MSFVTLILCESHTRNVNLHYSLRFELMSKFHDGSVSPFQGPRVHY